MSRIPRQHVRVPLSNPASLEMRSQSAVSLSQAQRKNVPVTLRDASLGGLSLEATAEQLDKGTTITIKLQIGTRSLQLPAQIVWSKKDSDGITSFAGVRIHLAVTDATTRKTWEAFINEQLKGAAKPVEAKAVLPEKPTEAQMKAAKLFDDLFK